MAGKEHEDKDKAPEGEETKKSSKMLLIIIVAVLVLILVIGGVIVALMSGGSEEGGDASRKEAPVHEKEASAEGEHAKPSGGGGHGEISTEVGIMFPVELFTVNLLSESGRRYLKVEMNLELDGEELALELETKKPILRDVIIRILSGKSLEEVSTIKGKEAVKEEILSDLNQRIKDGKIKNVYFTDFVVQ